MVVLGARRSDNGYNHFAEGENEMIRLLTLSAIVGQRVRIVLSWRRLPRIPASHSHKWIHLIFQSRLVKKKRLCAQSVSLKANLMFGASASPLQKLLVALRGSVLLLWNGWACRGSECSLRQVAPASLGFLVAISCTRHWNPWDRILLYWKMNAAFRRHSYGFVQSQFKSCCESQLRVLGTAYWSMRCFVDIWSTLWHGIVSDTQPSCTLSIIGSS